MTKNYCTCVRIDKNYYTCVRSDNEKLISEIYSSIS